MAYKVTSLSEFANSRAQFGELALPRTESASADCAKARLVLNKSIYLPREFWMEQSNGQEVKWDIPQLKENVLLSRKDFTEPQLPPGWKLERVTVATDAPPQKNDSLPAPDPRGW